MRSYFIFQYLRLLNHTVKNFFQFPLCPRGFLVRTYSYQLCSFLSLPWSPWVFADTFQNLKLWSSCSLLALQILLFLTQRFWTSIFWCNRSTLPASLTTTASKFLCPLLFRYETKVRFFPSSSFTISISDAVVRYDTLSHHSWVVLLPQRKLS